MTASPRQPDRFEPTGPAHTHPTHDPPPGDQPAGPRAFLSIYFRCSAQYTRAYKNASGTAYEARCPACAKPVRFAIGPGGTDQRAFTMSCT
jgi:hypothetical protein